jgi:hypothetical protein
MNGMNVTEIGEAVRVVVGFEPIATLKDRKGMPFPHHKIRPRSFVWHNREYEVGDITYVWRESIGDAFVYHFAVTESDNVFELCFNSSTMDWTLANVAHG